MRITYISLQITTFTNKSNENATQKVTTESNYLAYSLSAGSVHVCELFNALQHCDICDCCQQSNRVYNQMTLHIAS